MLAYSLDDSRQQPHTYSDSLGLYVDSLTSWTRTEQWPAPPAVTFRSELEALQDVSTDQDAENSPGDGDPAYDRGKTCPSLGWHPEARWRARKTLSVKESDRFCRAPVHDNAANVIIYTDSRIQQQSIYQCGINAHIFTVLLVGHLGCDWDRHIRKTPTRPHTVFIGSDKLTPCSYSVSWTQTVFLCKLKMKVGALSKDSRLAALPMHINNVSCPKETPLLLLRKVLHETGVAGRRRKIPVRRFAKDFVRPNCVSRYFGRKRMKPLTMAISQQMPRLVTMKIGFVSSRQRALGRSAAGSGRSRDARKWKQLFFAAITTGSRVGPVVKTRVRQSKGAGCNYRSGQIAYFHGLKTRILTSGTGDVRGGSDST